MHACKVYEIDSFFNVFVYEQIFQKTKIREDIWKYFNAK